MTCRFAALCAIFYLATTFAAAGQVNNPPTTKTSTNCAAAFKRYSIASTPIYFALSNDGKACAFSMCLGGCNKGLEKPITTLALCRDVSEGRPCEIYAFRGNVISNSGVVPGGN